MKQLTCEMCGSTDLLKQDGVFVCQSCGTKYSVEEAKKMMVEGTVEIQGTVRVDNTAQIQNYLELSQNAYASRNGQSAFDYANKVLEIEPQNSRAWIAKMKAIEYIATVGDPREKEVLEAGKNAIRYAAKDEKDAIELEVYAYQLTRSIGLLDIARRHFLDTRQLAQTYSTFSSIDSWNAIVKTGEADRKAMHPFLHLETIAEEMVSSIPEEALAKSDLLINLVSECADALELSSKAYDARSRVYIPGGYPFSYRGSTVEELRKKVQQLKERRCQAYWAEHNAEREHLEAEQQELYLKKDELEQQLKALTKTSDDLQNQIQEIDDNISNLKSKQQAILFRASAKKELQAQIGEAEKKKASLKEVLQREQEAHSKEIEQCYQRKDEINQRIAEIQAEFDKER